MYRATFILTITAFASASASSFTALDAQSAGMGHTGVAAPTPFNASTFNAAHLSTQQNDVRFSMILPSVRAYINDPSGLLGDIAQFVEEGGTIDQFESIDIVGFNQAVFGDDSEPGIRAVLTDISENVANIHSLTENYDGSNYAQLVVESNALSSNTLLLNEKTTTARAEVQTLENLSVNTRDSVDNLDGRELSVAAGATLLNIAVPREGTSFGFHLNSDISAGSKLFIERNDFTVVDEAIEDLMELTDLADTFSSNMVVVSERNEDLVNWLEEWNNVNINNSNEVQAWTAELVTREQALENAVNNTQSSFEALESYQGNFYNGNNDGSFELNQLNQDEFESQLEVLGTNVNEVGLTVARTITLGDQQLSFGVTAKMMNIIIFERHFSMNDTFDDITEVILESSASFFRPNLDLGVLKQWDDLWYGNISVGATIKDLIPMNLDSETGKTIEIRPKVRVGAAHHADWSTLAIDLDITENRPMGYGSPSRYLSLGGEINAYNWLKIRGGYRNNLSASGAHVISTGIGVTPWGVGIDLGAWFTPAPVRNWEDLIRDAGVAAQFSMQF